MAREPRTWDVDRLGEMSETAIRKLHQPSESFRVGRRKFPSGSCFPGAMMAGTCYVLKGACRYTFRAETIVIRAGMWAPLPSGDYKFEVLGSEDVETVLAWRLPLPSDSAQG